MEIVIWSKISAQSGKTEVDFDGNLCTIQNEISGNYGLGITPKNLY